MRKFITIFAVCLCINLSAQTHEFNVGMGYAYYVGDLNTLNNSSKSILAAVLDHTDLKNFKTNMSLG